MTAPANDLDPLLRCRACGYDLRGATTNPRCPECGAPVAMSMQSGNLGTLSPQWLCDLGNGASLRGCATLVFLLGLFFLVDANERGGPSWVRAAMIALGAIGSAAMVWAGWMLSSPDPMNAMIRDPSQSRIGETAFAGFASLWMLLVASLFVERPTGSTLLFALCVNFVVLEASSISALRQLRRCERVLGERPRNSSEIWRIVVVLAAPLVHVGVLFALISNRGLLVMSIIPIEIAIALPRYVGPLAFLTMAVQLNDTREVAEMNWRAAQRAAEAPSTPTLD